ncbi:hypothetical protein BKH42_00390 [Helicobacter sp. 13S00482-2]|uniref:hypothetical protein n=1 Tax=Helicobacter sp. 13S00482-2 TaxID=1476200 RepID=UPI000BA4EE19|nr:hypothetical protein [Helicobacter sp. 13S00482-2]PAF54410.1 hypothetical protein BKH42_00390 [Helicobacter sp. 13S00482-2]
MNCKYRCLIIFIIVNIAFSIVCSVLWKANGLINFQIGFFSFLLVIFSTYISLQKKLKKELKENQLETSSDDTIQENDNKKKPKTRFNFSTLLLGMQLSMGIFRILAYLILIFGITMLMNKNIFLAIPYIMGIMISLVGVVGLKLLLEKTKNKSNL